MDKSAQPANIDIAFVVENTTGLNSVADKVYKLLADIPACVRKFWMARFPDSEPVLRARVVAFSDFACDGSKAVRATDFFDLSSQKNKYLSAIKKLSFTTRFNDSAHSGLEGLYGAMHADWSKMGTKSDSATGRHVIIVISDSLPRHPHEQDGLKGYPRAFFPNSLAEMENIWDGNSLEYESPFTDPSLKRLFLLVPPGEDSEFHSWEDIAQWQCATTLGYDTLALYDDDLTDLTEDIATFIVADVKI